MHQCSVKFVKLDLLEENGYEKRQTSMIKTTVLQFMFSLRGRRFEREGKESLGKGSFRRERNARGARGGREGNACQETIVFLVFNIDQANFKILIG